MVGFGIGVLIGLVVFVFGILYWMLLVGLDQEENEDE